jgi:dipeptidyl aminopeptidase/acylaminoacyl peptidase
MSTSGVVDTDQVLRALLVAETNSQFVLSNGGTAVAYVRTTGAGQELWTDAGGRHWCLAVHDGCRLSDVRWTADDSTVVYRHAERGREAWHLSGVRVTDRVRVPLVADGSLAEYWLSPDTPALAFSRRTGTGRTDLYTVDLDRPDRPSLLCANPGYHRWLVDNALRPRGGIVLRADGSAQVLLGADPASARAVLTVDVDAVADLAVQRFSRDDTRLFVVTSAGAAVRRLVAIGADATTRTVYAHPALDLGGYPVAGDGVWFDPGTGEPDLCSVMDQRLRYHPLTPRIRVAVDRLRGTTDAGPVLTGRSRDDRVWLVSTVHDRGPLEHAYVWPETGRRQAIAVNRPELIGVDLPGLRDLSVTAGDGCRLEGYLLRPAAATGALPTVVLVHGGPAARDLWRFHAEAQYLAALGYQSVHLNYRGSTGFGTAFRLAGNGEWGGRMQEDLYDAVRHGIDTGLVDPHRIAFFGASYGGYAALLAACTRPDLVRCAVAVSPPCDLTSFVDTPPGYWRPLAVQLRRQVVRPVGGGEVDAGTLDARSPLHAVDPSCAPVLIAHGVRDPRVPVGTVDAFVDRSRRLGNTVRYLRFDDEGHFVHGNDNRALLYREVAEFLEVHLGTG